MEEDALSANHLRALHVHLRVLCSTPSFQLSLDPDNSILGTVVNFFNCIQGEQSYSALSTISLFITVSEGFSVLSAIPSVSCEDSEYTSLRPLIYFLLIVFIIGGVCTESFPSPLSLRMARSAVHAVRADLEQSQRPAEGREAPEALRRAV